MRYRDSGRLKKVNLVRKSDRGIWEALMCSVDERDAKTLASSILERNTKYNKDETATKGL